MKFEYNKKEIKHSEIMEKLGVECRSNKNGFKLGKTDRIDNIRELLQDSGYHEVLLSGVQIWRKDFSSPIDVIVSSHVDTVESITKCSSVLDDEGYYTGTYDNAGTNSAAVIAMLEKEIPSNVVFAFTSEEETGRCLGMKQMLEYALSMNYNPICIALDVTYEGYDEGNLFTVENLSSGNKKNEDMEFINKVGQWMMDIEPDGTERVSTFVRLHKDAIPKNLDKDYISKDAGWFDEGQAYAKAGMRTFSFCLPCEGSMHSNRGVSVREPGFEGYVNSLSSMIYMITNTNELLLENNKKENALLYGQIKEQIKEEIEEAKRIEEERKSKIISYTNSENYYNGSNFYTGKNYYNQYADHDYDYDSYDDYDTYDDSYACMFDEYDEEYYGEFDDYIGYLIDSIYDLACGYDSYDIEPFMSDLHHGTSSKIKSYFGGTEKFLSFIKDAFMEVHNIELEENFEEEEIDEEDEYENDLKYDEDGFEYADESLSYFYNMDEIVDLKIKEIKKREEDNVFSNKEVNLLKKYANIVEDSSKVIEKINQLANIILHAPNLRKKETLLLEEEVNALIANEENEMDYSDIYYDELD